MKLFVYEHCPYCTRARIVLGYKNIPCEIEYLLDDDIDGHMEKIGSKQVPIFQDDDGDYMGESLDIVDYLDNLDSNPIFKPTVGRPDIDEFMNDIRPHWYNLTYSYTATAKLPEFATESARQHFVNRFLKKADVNSLDEAIARREEDKKNLESVLPKLDELIYSKEHISEGGLSMDDIIYFSNFHRLSIIPNLKMPPKLKSYMEYQLSKNNCDIVYEK